MAIDPTTTEQVGKRSACVNPTTSALMKRSDIVNYAKRLLALACRDLTPVATRDRSRTPVRTVPEIGTVVTSRKSEKRKSDRDRISEMIHCYGSVSADA
jgi:hypothetical protein